MDDERAKEIAEWLTHRICESEDTVAERLKAEFEEACGEEIEEIKEENKKLRQQRDSAVAELIARQPMSPKDAEEFVAHLRALYDNIDSVMHATKWLRDGGFGTLEGVAKAIDAALKTVYLGTVSGRGLPE